MFPLFKLCGLQKTLWSAKDEVCLCLPLDEVAPFMALCVCVFASEDDKGIKT